MSSIIIPSPEELRLILNEASPGLVFSQAVKRQTVGIISGKFRDQAVSRSGVDGITIDGPDTLDADDAIWCEKGNKGYRVYVSITDVSEVIEIFSPLGIEALIRAISIYLHPSEIPMFPESLSHDKYSLNGKRKHIALTVVFDVSKTGKIKASLPYESLLHHRGKLTHEEASFALRNKDAEHHEQLALLSEVASLINQVEGRDLGLSGLREESPQSVSNASNPHFKIHKIIETLMVSTNRIIAGIMSEDSFGIYRQHVHPLERAFYATKPGPHAGLGVKRGGYTHFTSPLRRYPDFLVHKLLKSKFRRELPPVSLGHVQVIVDYVNRRVFEIDTIQQYKKNEAAGARSIEKIQNRYGRKPKAHELKHQIRRSANEPYLLPHAVRSCILDDIEDPDSTNWQWAVGIILLGNDDTLKEALWNQVITKRAMPPLSFLNSLAETRLVLGEEKVFRIHEITDASSCTVKIELQDGKVLSVKKPLSRKYNINHVRGRARKDLMFKIFRYYLDS